MTKVLAALTPVKLSFSSCLRLRDFRRGWQIVAIGNPIGMNH
jgi:hypothetical protein